MRLLKKHPILSIANSYVVDFPSPSNISYWWNFGSLLGITLIIQIVTGVFLGMHYIPHVDLAFISVEHIMRDVHSGWLIRYAHANGASLFFILVYFHIARGMYYGSYLKPRVMTWNIGVIIFFLMMGVAFLGYCLPFGQMSFWGATVITNMVSAVPWIGKEIVQFIWGGYAVDNATLTRFFSLHYLLPFVLVALSAAHLIALHEKGGNNPLGVGSEIDKVPFHPYYTIKDIYGFILYLISFLFLIGFEPNMLGHPDNYVPANPMVTPSHIEPEWYFLPFYAILRAIPNKLGGVVAMVGAILILMLLPMVNRSEIRSGTFRPIYKKIYWLFLFDVILLGWIGGKPVEEPYVMIGIIGTFLYFSYFFVLIPLIGEIEKILVRGWMRNFNDCTSIYIVILRW